MPDIDEQMRELEEEISLDDQAEGVGQFFNGIENTEISDKRREREAKKNQKVDYAAAGEFMSERYNELDAIEKKREERKAKKNQKVDYAAAGEFMSIQEKRAEREAKKDSKVNYDIAGRFMSDEYKRKERADKKAAPGNEPLELGDFFETDEEKLLRTYVDNKNKHIKELKEKAETQKAAVAKVSKGKRKKIADIEERDKHIAEREAALKKQNTAIESARFEIESIKKSKENLISSKKTKSNTEIEQGENKEKSSVEIKAAEKAVNTRKEIIQAVTSKKEKAQKQLQVLKEEEEKKRPDDALVKIIKAADEMLKSQNEELAKEEATLKEKQTAMESAEAQMKQAGEDVKSIEAQIAKYDELLKQKEEELKKLEELHKKDTQGWDEYKEDQEERKKEKWYQDYLAEKNKLDAINSEIASNEEALASAQSQDGTRFKFKTVGETGNGHTVMVDSMTGEGTTLEEKTSEDEAVAEETRVEEALKNAPVLKDLNKDELPKYIGYNPKTGEMGGAPKEDGKTNEAAKKEEQKEPDKKDESDAAKGSEDEAKAVDKILSNKTREYLDTLMARSIGFQPIQTLTIDLRDNGMEKAHKTVIDIMDKVRSANAGDKASQIMLMITTSIDVLFDGDKDDNLLAGLEAKKAESLSEKVSKQKVYDILLKGLELPDEILREGPKQNMSSDKSDVQNATDYIANSKKDVKDVMKVISKSIDTHKLLGEAKAFKGKNDQFARMLEGAYRQQVGETTAGAVNTGLSIAQKAVNTFAGLGDGTLSKVINGVFNGVGMLTNKVASSIAQKRDKSKVLDSPEVLGNVKYDKKKVPDYKFNSILKRVSGITSKDGLYNVVKVTDAVTLHSNMKANKADPIVGRVMSDLGYKDQTEYDKVKVTDILAKTGHPTGDWRGELRKSMVDNGQTEKKTFGQKVKGFAKKAWGGIKKLFGSDKNKVEAD